MNCAAGTQLKTGISYTTPDDCIACPKGFHTGGEAACVACLAGRYKDTLGGVSENTCKRKDMFIYLFILHSSFFILVRFFIFSLVLVCYLKENFLFFSHYLLTLAKLEQKINHFFGFLILIYIVSFPFVFKLILQTVCPIGSFGLLDASIDFQNTNVIGEKTCLKCLTGKWSDVEGLNDQSSCLSCPSGRISHILGATSEDTCDPCAAGLYSASLARSGQPGDCDGCPTGKSSEIEGLNNIDQCEACDLGKYNNLPGQSVCQDCLRGRYGNTTGNVESSDCIGCVEGKYLPTYGNTLSSACIDCPNGFYSNEIGTQSVALFPDNPNSDDNRYFFESGTKVCGCTDDVKCTEYTTGERLLCKERTTFVTCKHCVLGKYLNLSGKTSAVDCLSCGT